MSWKLRLSCNYIRIPLFLSFITAWAFTVDAQLILNPSQIRSNVESQIPNLKQKFSNAQVNLNPTTGLPSSIVGLDTGINSVVGTDPVDAATKLLNEQTVRSLLPFAANNGIKTAFQKTGTRNDPASPGNTTVTFRQTLAGIPVFGGTARVTVNPRMTVTQASFNLVQVTPDIVTTRTLSDLDAKNSARKLYADLLSTNKLLSAAESELFGNSPQPHSPKLEFFDPTILGKNTVPGGLRLCWEVTVGGIVFFIDANSGALVDKYRNVP
jgi:Fungalysin/Thermolysin Propeptide Motif